MMKRQRELHGEIPDGVNICEFCYLSDERRILHQNESIYVLPTMGSFVEGYVLLVSQSHDDCFADILNPRTIESKEVVRDTIEETYGDCVFFEHGNVGTCFTRGNCKIDFHAHLHCVPTNKDISDKIAEDHTEFKLDSLYELEEYKQRHPHYMFFENNEQDMYFYPIEYSVESQYLRKRICEAMDLDVIYADWREFEFRQHMEQTAKDLEKKFQGHYDSN